MYTYLAVPDILIVKMSTSKLWGILRLIFRCCRRIDRDDWRKGRKVDSIEGVWYNETYVPFETVVVATGGEHTPDPITTTFGIGWDRRTEYYLIGEVSDLTMVYKITRGSKASLHMYGSGSLCF